MTEEQRQDLQSELTVALGWLQVLNEGWPGYSEPERRHMLTKATGAAQRAAALVHVDA